MFVTGNTARGVGASLAFALAHASVASAAPNLAPASEAASLNAGAPSQNLCLDAYEHAQRARGSGKLLEARQDLIICSQVSCPEIARHDCEPWLRAVEASMPTVVFRARDARGRDAVDVQVAVDGKPFVPLMDGQARPIDPGVHVFRFATADLVAIEQKLVIVEGEKHRLITVDFAQNTTTEAPTTAAEPTGSGTSVPTLAIVFGAAGLVSLGSFAYFAATGLAKRSELERTCVPACSEAAVSSARTRLIVGDISLGLGVASLGVASWLLFARPKTTSAAISFAPTRGGAMTSLRGTF